MSKEKEDTKKGIFENPFILIGIIIIASVLLISSQSERLLISGNAVIGEDFIGDISGEWFGEEENWEECYRPNTIQESKSTMLIKQVNEKLVIIYEEKDHPEDDTTLFGEIKGNKIFLTGIDFEDDDAIDDVTGITGTISADCNSLELGGEWTETEGSNVCKGTFEWVGTRNNPTGCGVPATVHKPKPIETVEEPKEVIEEPTKPAPSINYDLIGLVSVALLLVAVIVFLIMMLYKKRKGKYAKELNQLIEKIYDDLNKSDTVAAVNDYDALQTKFAEYKEKLNKRDLERIYKDSVEVYKSLVKENASKYL